jgi:N-acetyl-anhydromuramyl-L-alanine amidase AmpD
MNIISKPLTKGYSKGWTRTPWCIVLHYTAGYTSNQCYDVLSKRGLSVHFTIERDGKLYRYLDDGDRGWHAGYGQWGGRSNMNHHSFGVEIVNFGWADGEFTGSSPYGVYRHKSTSDPEIFPSNREFYRDEKYKNSKVRVVTKQECAQFLDHRGAWDGKYWATYPDAQIEAVSWQVWQWMKEYKILPENVVGHEHVTPHRKSDPGPAFPWKKIEERIARYAKCEMPELYNIEFNNKGRVKAVQSHCSRMGIPVGDIDGWWGRKTEAGVKLALAKYGETYGFSALEIDPQNITEIANALRRIPGFDPGRR